MAGNKTARRTFIFLLILAVLATWIWWATRAKPISVAVAAAEKGTVEKTVANTRAGTVKACRRAKLSPSAGGQIDKLPVSEGQQVKQGDLLLELWNDDIEAQLALTLQEANAAAATSLAKCIEAEQAQREANRLKKLLSRKLVSEEQVDQAETAAQSGSAACEASRATALVSEGRIGVTQATLEKTRLIAPFDGVVAEINGELNEYVTPSPIGIPTPPAVDLIANDCFYLTAPIDEVDVAQISVGQTARITLDAFGERRFDGKVRRIADYVLDVEKQARTVDVEVEFVNKADIEQLLAGYSADVEIILDIRKDTLRIPTEALIEGNKVYVYLPDSQVVEKREVKPGTANWDFTEVSDGLAEGDLVVTSVDREGLDDGVAAKREKADEK
ncbi:efflux RND transporter periplasmic adaptor subunit [Thiosocius teredinicola]|uniref:efflux RND transporter periplasmic adaptor subunit n=1 Tax=Thiosocius teredinicola TaxID=1973002 RepID=UPI000991201C